jgi:hypothetical protein
MSTVSDIQTVKVQTKAKWADTWADAPYVFPIQSVERAAPSISRAIIQDEYGLVKREDTSQFVAQEPLDLENHFARIVQVESDSSLTPLFVGWIPSTGIQPHSPVDDGQGGSPVSGTWRAEVLGLETLLDDKRVWGSVAESGSGTVNIDATLIFNQRSGEGWPISAIAHRANTPPPTG